MAMTKTYLLIDLQNRKPSPECVAAWMGTDGEAWIFFGEQEIGLLASYMELGERVSLVDISKPGKNSLDFHLVLYLGYLVGRHERNARYVIVAEDGDYDPAIVHARSKGRKIERIANLGAAPSIVEPSSKTTFCPPKPALEPATGKASAPVRPVPKAKKPRSVSFVYGEMLKDFRVAGKPKSLEALKRRIQWRFGPEPAHDNVAAVIARLETMDVINVINGTLNYIQAAPEFMTG